MRPLGSRLPDLRRLPMNLAHGPAGHFHHISPIAWFIPDSMGPGSWNLLPHLLHGRTTSQSCLHQNCRQIRDIFILASVVRLNGVICPRGWR